MRPMLAAKVIEKDTITQDDVRARLQKMRYPLFCSPKVDGIRALIHPLHGAVSRTFKELPNAHIQKVIRERMGYLQWLDCEIVVGNDPAVAGLFNQTQSAVMSEGGEPRFMLCVFDCFDQPTMSYDLRLQCATSQVRTFQQSFNANNDEFFVRSLEFVVCPSPEAVLDYEEICLERGYEGIMLRDPKAPYKFNRSTFKEQGLVKLKRTQDAEATVIGFEELLRNKNEQQRDNFGLAKRSSHQEGKVPGNLLGNLIVRHDVYGEFSIGSGFDIPLREKIWLNKEAYLGKTVTFKFQPIGLKEKPRHPIFKGFRHD